MPATGSPASWAPGKVLPGLGRCRSPGEKDVKTSPPCGEGSLQEKVSLLPERDWHTREGLSHWTEPWSAWQGDPARILVSPPEARMGDAQRKPSAAGLQKASLPRQRR
jgi:hypothetical protein